MPSNNTAANVSAGKPKKTGSVFVAPAGTTLPTSTSASLDSFESLGYVSDEGLSHDNAIESEETNAWGGDLVLDTQTKRTDTFSLNFIEALNINVLKLVYGDDNVSTTTEGMKIEADSGELEEKVVVIDVILTGNVPKRIVIPRAKVTELGETTYVDNEPIGYPVTWKALSDSNGKTHYEYFGTAS